MKVVQANIEVHTRMADSYERMEPHFRPENQAAVRRILQDLSRRTGNGRMLDLGCGTGFMIRLASDIFAEIHGVDVTLAMLQRVDTTTGNVQLHNTPAEQLPFADNYFDLITAYSFLHHAEDHRQILQEAHRVLKVGGLLYADLEPNKLFWEQMESLRNTPADQLPAWVLAARESVLSTDARVEREYGIPRETFRLAEYTKSVLGGIDPRTIAQETAQIGFRSCELQLVWYVGQAQVMHGKSFEEAERIDDYLHSISPLADHLFKYVRFVLTK